MDASAVTIILKGNLPSLNFEITSYSICDGCVFFCDSRLLECCVIPLTSIVSFYVKPAK